MVTNLKTPASRKQKQEDGKFKAILRHVVRLLSTKASKETLYISFIKNNPKLGKNMH